MNLSLLDKLEWAKEVAEKSFPKYKGLIGALSFDVGEYPVFALDLNDMTIKCPSTNKWFTEELIFVIMHEVLHMYKGDVYFMELFGSDKKWHIAADISINSFLVSLGLKAPPGAYLPKKYNLPDNLSSFEYYQLLQGIDI